MVRFVSRIAFALSLVIPAVGCYGAVEDSPAAPAPHASDDAPQASVPGPSALPLQPALGCARVLRGAAPHRTAVLASDAHGIVSGTSTFAWRDDEGTLRRTRDGGPAGEVLAHGALLAAAAGPTLAWSTGFEVTVLDPADRAQTHAAEGEVTALAAAPSQVAWLEADGDERVLLVADAETGTRRPIARGTFAAAVAVDDAHAWIATDDGEASTIHVVDTTSGEVRTGGSRVGRVVRLAASAGLAVAVVRDAFGDVAIDFEGNVLWQAPRIDDVAVDWTGAYFLVDGVVYRMRHDRTSDEIFRAECAPRAITSNGQSLRFLADEGAESAVYALPVTLFATR